MFLVGGTAIDLARHENLRTSLQYNLDRAVLAAASLRQTQDPKLIVESYMSKVQTIEDFTVVVDSTVSLNARAVAASATAELDTWFLSMAGINSMPITVKASSEERIPNLEISLVLDVSGSMRGTKLTNLQAAAKEFVTTLLNGADTDTVAISVIPFNQNVAPSIDLFSKLNIVETHTLSTCLQFEDADFDSVSIDPAVAQTQAIYTSRYGYNYGDFEKFYQTCFPQPQFQTLPYSDDETVLHAKIDSLEASGYTAGHMGMKWGLALLDPKFQPVVTALIDDEQIDEGFAGLPVAYSEPDTKKIVVFMGDGGNTYEYGFGDAYKGPNSNMWEITEITPGGFTHLTYFGYVYTGAIYEQFCSWSTTTCFYSDPTEEVSYYVHDVSHGEFYDIEEDEWISNSEFLNLTPDDGNSLTVEQLSWEEAWGFMSAEYYDRLTGENARSNLRNNGRNGTQSDQMMTKACNAARNAGVIVYTIGYQTHSTTSQKLRDCASTISHYYDASGTQISSVFSAIATSIQRLKLTQ